MRKLFIILVVVLLMVPLALFAGKKKKEPKAPAEQKTIVYWSMWTEGESSAEVIRGWISEYEEMNPGITIEVSFKGRELMSAVSAALSAGEKIDIVEDEEFHIKPLLGKADRLLVLDEAMSAPRYEGDKSWRENFLGGGVVDKSNVIYVPYSIFTSGFSYNKTLWNKNGWKPFTTWDDFLKLCATVKKTTKLAPLALDGMVDRYCFWWFREIIARLEGNTASIVSAVEDKTGESWVKNPNFKRAMEMERELFKKDYFIDGVFEFVWPQGQETMTAGETAMLFCGSWIPFEMANKVDSDWEWGFFAFPAISGGKGVTTDLVNLSIGWSILKDSDVTEECIEFLKYITSVENSQKYGDATNLSSTVREVVPPPALADVQKVLDSATSVYAWDVIPFYGDYHSGVLLKNHLDAFRGLITPDQFVKKMKEDTINYWKNK
jgi:raffinose/stachyose/melibiose transport system substrate-binding protein